ncbi:hypothetical protein BD626DRAFT_497037 [Schizophyllum amplum]|uniref:Uncharacterized protein n=1 Tax=Schizophyllum amplum TaxID=97359 RepID=A0A550CDQ8_9AGAR|nr:hypothetical protein BD626DRAFT_497037 [Auriculariopsis ampla]
MPDVFVSDSNTTVRVSCNEMQGCVDDQPNTYFISVGCRGAIQRPVSAPAGLQGFWSPCCCRRAGCPPVLHLTFGRLGSCDSGSLRNRRVTCVMLDLSGSGISSATRLRVAATPCPRSAPASEHKRACSTRPRVSFDARRRARSDIDDRLPKVADKATTPAVKLNIFHVPCSAVPVRHRGR